MRGEDLPLCLGLESGCLGEPPTAWPAALTHPVGHLAVMLAPPGTKCLFLMGEEYGDRWSSGDRAQQGLDGRWEQSLWRERNSPV